MPTSNISVLLVPIRPELTAHGSRYIAAERKWTCSKHITWSLSSHSTGASVGCTENTSHDHWPLLWRHRGHGKHLHLLLRVGPCLQSCCVATGWSNPLQYLTEFWFELKWIYLTFCQDEGDTNLPKQVSVKKKKGRNTRVSTCSCCKCVASRVAR
jgi:hypothetical protein